MDNKTNEDKDSQAESVERGGFGCEPVAWGDRAIGDILPDSETAYSSFGLLTGRVSVHYLPDAQFEHDLFENARWFENGSHSGEFVNWAEADGNSKTDNRSRLAFEAAGAGLLELDDRAHASAKCLVRD